MSESLSQLEQLVESLTAHERRYVRTALARLADEEKTQVLQLYDTLIHPPKTTVSKPFSASQQNYLYRAILKILRSYHESKTLDIQIRERLTNAALLYERRLYALSLRELDTVQKLATENERWAAVLDILALKMEVILEHNSNDILEKLTANAQEAQRIHTQLGLITSLKNQQFQVYAFCRINYHNRSEETLQALKAVAPEYDASQHASTSLFEQHYRMMSDAGQLYFSGAYREAMHRYGELLEVWERYPVRQSTERLIYKRFLSNVLAATHAAIDFERMRDILHRLKAIPVTTIEEEAEKFQNLTYMELLYLMNTDGFDDLPALTQTIENGFRKYKTKINKARELAFAHNLGMAYFLMHDWKQALHWIERIVTHEKTEHRKDLQHTARMLRLVLWYELNKYDLLEYELINVERFLRKRKAWFAYEATVVKVFEKLIVTDEQKKQAHYERFKTQLESALAGKTSAALPGSSELMYWVNSKLTGVSMRELLRAD